MQANPIEKNPQTYAQALIRKRVETILRLKLLDHAVSLTLAREYLFAYVDKYTEQLGLSKKDRYTVAELEAAFTNYYPRWLVEAQKVQLARNNSAVFSSTIGADGSAMLVYDPDLLKHLDQPTKQVIQHQVTSQIAAGLPVPIITLTGNRLSPALFAGMLDFVKRKGCRSVVRLYKPGDISYLKKCAFYVQLGFIPAIRSLVQH